MYHTCKLISVLDWFVHVYPSVNVHVGIDLPQFVYEFARLWDIIIHVRVYHDSMQSIKFHSTHPWIPSFIAVQLCC
jgi:hypothetical protein